MADLGGVKTETERVFELLAEYGFTDREFCIRTGFCYSTLNSWRNGRRNPSTSLINEFCKCLGITKDVFYSEGIYAIAPRDKSHSGESENVTRLYAIYSNKVLELGIEAKVLPFIKNCVEMHMRSL